MSSYKNKKISKTKIGNGYLITYIDHNGNMISGFIDKDNNEIIPFKPYSLIEIFKSNDKKDIGLGFNSFKEKKKIYYHLRMIDNKVLLMFDTTNFNDELKLYIVDKNSRYWALEDTSLDKCALYDYKEGNIKSFFFDELLFLDNGINNHYFFYKVHLVNDKYEPYSYKTICGYLDSDANLSSQILDCETSHIYDSKTYGPNTLDVAFNQLLLTLNDLYLDDCLTKEEDINNRVIALNEDSFIKQDLETKILKFNSNRKKV